MLGAVLDQALSIVAAARTELILFFLAFAIHYCIFGSGLSWALRVDRCGKQVGKRRPEAACAGGTAALAALGGEGPAEEEGAGASPEDLSAQLRCSCAAYARGDHRGVLRCWQGGLKHLAGVPASHLAQVVESMQRFKRDGTTIVGEVRGYLERHPTACHVAYINELLEPLAKSLDTEVAGGLAECLPGLGVHPDSGTYEALVQMHFATRSFDAVARLAGEMRSNAVKPSHRVGITLLKTALQTGQLDEALRCYRDVAECAAGQPSASAAPSHIAAQLVELACRERRPGAVLGELEGGRMPLTAEALNALLAEAVRASDGGAVEQLLALAAARGVAKNGHTYQLLMRHAGADRAQLSALLAKLAADGAECTQEAAQAVLAAAGPARDVALADRVHAQLVRADQARAAPALLALIRFYCEAGEPAKACATYERHARSWAADGAAAPAAPAARRRALVDARTERCLVNAALQCGREDLAAQLLEATPADTARHIAMIRGCASRGSLSEALRVFAALRESGAELTHSLWNTALDACVECRDLRRAEELMQEMEAAGVADVVSYNTLIKAHLRQDSFARARGVMDAMRSAGCHPNHVTYNELIHALMQGDRDCWRAQAWQAVDEMCSAGVRPNRVTCSILLKSLKAKSPHADIQRTMELTSAMGEPLDEVLLSSVVEACMRVGKPALLAQKLEELQGSAGIAVTGAHTFGSLIRAYGHVKNISGAWRCWKEMRSQHIRPTSITIGCMVEAVVTNGDIDGGYELVLGLLDDELCRDQVNAVVFGSVLKGYGRARRMERVWAVFKEMLSRGIEPSVITFNAVIDGCARNNQMERVPELLQEMASRGLRPNLITYSTMIKGSCQRGDMPAALATLRELRRAPDLQPDEIVYNTVLDGCVQAGLVAEGERLFQEMEAVGIQPSGYTLAVLVRLFGQGRRLDRAFELVEAVTRRYRFKANAHVYGALMQACLQCREAQRAVSVYEQAVRDRVQPEGKACMSLIRALVSAGSHIQAVSLLRAMLGLAGRRAGAAADRGGAAPGSAIDDAFVGEVVAGIAASGKGGPLAAAFLVDYKAARPRARIEPSLERRLLRAAAAGA